MCIRDRAEAELGDGEGQGEPDDEERDAVEGRVEARSRHHEDRPVPQVQPVRALADVAPGLRPHPPAQRRRGMAGHGDEDCHDEGQQEEAAAVHPRGELPDGDEEPDDPRERGQAGSGDDDDAAGRQGLAEAAGPPEGRQGGTDELESDKLWDVPEIRRAGGLDALRRLGRPVDVVKDAKMRLFGV